ncbi:MAG: response regulator [bacterium]|nr:response regulator [bacterium]
MSADQSKATKILLAEDNQESYEMFSEYLEAWNYCVIRAQDGKEVIHIAREQHPDIILMDIQMPKMNGLEATRILKKDEELRHIPIIALTALAMGEDREHCLDAGVDAYVSKPVSLKKVMRLLESLLKR